MTVRRAEFSPLNFVHFVFFVSNVLNRYGFRAFSWASMAVPTCCPRKS